MDNENNTAFESDDFVSNDESLNWYGRLKKKIASSIKKNPQGQRKMHHMVSYGKYGYFFLVPFFLIFIIFNLLPLLSTIYYSFFEYYKSGLKIIGPTFIGFKNYATLLKDTTFWKFFGNTMLIWIIGFIPQIIVSLLLAIWFTDSRLKLKMSGFFKAIMYMPNLVMASAFGMLFLMFFSNNGPVNQILASAFGKDTIYFLESKTWVRVIISFINWLMWFGNTSILLMSGIMGIDESIFESARLDGSSSMRTFWKITMPLLMPIFVYVLITSLIGGIQLFDAAQIFTNANGGPDMCATTLMMYLYKLITVSRNYGLGGAVSVIIFIFTGILSIIIFKTLVPNYNAIKQEKKAYQKRMRWLAKEDNKAVMEVKSHD